MELAGAVREADTFKITVPNLAQARQLLDKLIGERIPEHIKRKLREGRETMNKNVRRRRLRVAFPQSRRCCCCCCGCCC